MDSCQHIDQVIKLAVDEGNAILSESQSELMDKVIWMNNKLSVELRDKIIAEMKTLIYEKTKDMPHNPATEYFICNNCKIAVIFPLNTAK